MISAIPGSTPLLETYERRDNLVKEGYMRKSYEEKWTSRYEFENQCSGRKFSVILHKIYSNGWGAALPEEWTNQLIIEL